MHPRHVQYKRHELNTKICKYTKEIDKSNFVTLYLAFKGSIPTYC